MPRPSAPLLQRAHLRHRLPSDGEGRASLQLDRASSSGANSSASLQLGTRVSRPNTPSRSLRSAGSGSLATVDTPAAAAAAAARAAASMQTLFSGTSSGGTPPVSGPPSYRPLTRHGSRDASAAALQPLAESPVHHGRSGSGGGWQQQQQAPAWQQGQAADGWQLREAPDEDELAAELAHEAAAAALLPYEIDAAQVLVGERLAVGGFAEVFVGRYGGTLVAIKLLLSVDEAGFERFADEVTTLAALRHPNIVLFM